MGKVMYFNNYVKRVLIMFEMNRVVTYSQVGSNLTMDMAGVVHYLQDCTLAHSESVGKGLSHVAIAKRAWFLSSWQIEAERFPEYQERVTVRTWAHEFKGMYGYRNLDILDVEGKAIVCANSIWIFMDLAKMCPTKPTEEDMRGYEPESAIEMEYAPRKIKQLSEEFRVNRNDRYDDRSNVSVSECNEPDKITREGSFQGYENGRNDYHSIIVRPSFLDSNNHVNNGRYVSEALDLIGRADAKNMRVDYRKAAVLGDIMYPAVYENDELTQVVLNDSEGKPFVLVEVRK